MTIFSSALFTNLVIIFLSAAAIIVIYFKWSFNYWKRRGVYTPSPSIPFGNIYNAAVQNVTLGEDIRNIYKECKTKNLRYGGLYFLSKPIFLLYDPETIKTILSKDFQYFTDHGNYTNEEVDPLSGHLFGLKGLKWRHLRVKLTPTFTSGKMKMMFQTLVDYSDELVVVMDKASKDQVATDIKDVVARFATDIIGSCAFGIQCNSLKDPNCEFRKYGKKIFKFDEVQAVKSLLALCFPQVLHFFKLPFNRNDVTKFFLNIVNETVNYRESNNVARKDFMHLLIQLKNNIKLEADNNNLKLTNGNTAEKTLTLPELTAQAFIFFAAGFETSSTTITFCLYELVQNQEIQEKLRNEIKDILEKHDGKLSYESLTEMTYMDKCINETLRKYPPIPVLNRLCNKTYKIPESDVTIEKGILVFLPILGIQRDPEHYPDPENFDPERFSSENKATRHLTWLPFGEGPRACIGIRFGLMQTKIALTALLKNYRFTLNPKTETPLFLDPKSFIISAKGGIWLNSEKLTSTY